MRFFKNKNIYALFLSLSTLLIMSSCIYENLEIPADTVPGEIVEDTGYCLTMKINLSSMGGTRAGSFEDYEDYINPQNLRIFFFYGDENDDSKYNTLIKQFKITSNANPDGVAFIPANSSGSSMSKEWYVRIPVNQDMESFANKLRNYPFKIAVMANFPTSTPDLQEEIDATSTTARVSGDHIDRIHHLESTTVDSYRSNATYDFLLDERYPDAVLGKQLAWAYDGYNNDAAAETFIRNEFGPLTATNPSEDLKAEYEDLWLLWNFDGAVTGNASSYSFSKFSTEWATKNSSEFQTWLKKSIGNVTGDQTSAQIPLESWKAQSSLGVYYDNGEFEYTKGTEGRSYVDKIEDGQYGIVLFPGEYKDINSTNNPKIHDIIKIKLPNSGYHTVKWKAIDPGAKLKLEYRKNIDDETPGSSVYPSEGTWKVDKAYEIDGSAQYLHIYAEGGKVILYEIEHIASNYVYNVARYGYQLDDGDHAIPMYGIQSFDKLEDDNKGYRWEPGTTFDLSTFNQLTPSGYDAKSIYLLRSVAKVELRIPKSLGSHHVYLRSMNRNARCEPLDISTPTKDLWPDDDNGLHNTDCEFFELVGKSPFYESSFSGSGTQYDAYRSKLAWWYGNWSKDGITVGGVNINTGLGTDYPHILNPLIGRTDCCRFNESNSDSYYDRYVLYVPEKFVDDPGSTGSSASMITTTPKVCHIEFRVDEDPYANVDDDECYRIYFTPGGYNPEYSKLVDFKNDKNKNVQSWERMYERNVENLKTHWPIMRNHVYSFTVTEINTKLVVSKVEVLPWKMVEGNNYAW